MKVRSRFLVPVLFLMLSWLLMGCFFQKAVETSEVGLFLPDGARVESVLPAGIHSAWGTWGKAKLVKINASNITITWEDPSLVTSDKQPIGLTLGISFSRDRSCAIEMYRDYRAEATSDEALIALINNRIPRVAKAVTTQFSLDEMLGVESGDVGGGATINRALVEGELSKLLAPELEEFCVILQDVGANDILPSDAYVASLEEKANSQIATEVSRQRTLQLQEQLKQEEAQTNIELERARRENLVNEELAQVYEQSDRYFELERLRLTAGIVSSNAQFWFVPPGTDLSLLLSSNGSGMPIPMQVPESAATPAEGGN